MLHRARTIGQEPRCAPWPCPAAAPDGYTLLMGTVGTHGINEALYSKLPYSPLGDFQPITRVAMVPNQLVAHPSRPYKTVKELIEHAKAQPG